MIELDKRTAPNGKVYVIVAKCSSKEEAVNYKLEKELKAEYELLPGVQASVTDSKTFPYFRVAQLKM